jgi:hypothetical protein
MTCKSIISTFHSFLNAADFFPKTPSPNPARIPPQTPPAGGKSAEAGRIRNPRQIVSPCLVRIEAPPPARILGGQNTKEKCPFLFRRNWSRANPKSKEHFSLVSAEALRGGGGADSFVQFPLEKSSRKVYNYGTRSNLFGIKNMERFCGSQNRALIFAKTLSAYGGSREIP